MRAVSSSVKKLKWDSRFEELAHALGVSFATANRWENGKTSPSKLARNQFKVFCEQKKIQGLLVVEGER